MGKEAAVTIREQLRKGRTAGPGDDEAPLSVSAKQIRAILTGKKLRPGQPMMTFRNLRITGRLDLSACEIRSVVVFRSCAFEEQIQLEKASGVEFKFLGCRLEHGIRAYQAQFSGDVELTDGCEVGGSLQFSYARVRGALRVVGCVFHGVPAGAGGNAWPRSHSRSASRVWCRNGVVILPGVRVADVTWSSTRQGWVCPAAVRIRSTDGPLAGRFEKESIYR